MWTHYAFLGRYPREFHIRKQLDYGINYSMQGDFKSMRISGQNQSNTKLNAMLPDLEKVRSIHPGAVLKHALKKKGMTASDFKRTKICKSYTFHQVGSSI